jgi:predicted ATPase/class 3 adenylate cyclase
MPDLPTGTVTFLFTDIEGSTRLWEQHPEAMEAALARHDALAAAIVQQHAGTLVKQRGEGDSLFAVFTRATDAVDAATALQRALCSEPWPTETPLGVRMALHTGEAALREGDYYGAAVNRCARLRAVGHGGQVLLSRTTCDLVREHLPAGASLQDLGSHRLKDLQQPEQIFRLLHPDLPADCLPLRSLESFAHNLPAQLTSFIGREPEMAQVKQFLATTRLLTLTGSGGCGKTRLALQVAADLLEEYPDGVWLVELAPLADPALVPQTMAAALGVREEPGRPLTKTLADHLRSRALLLILDNCEHLLSASAQLADTLLRSCPNLRVLASSREGLGVAGEQTYRVPSLSVPEPQDLPSPERLQEFEAVQLFAARATLSQSAFVVTEGNASAVVQVCRRLDGIPLAIELAAARVKALPVEQVATRLDDMFRLLTGGSRTALPRQQTLRALIDWSYNLLSDGERLLLPRLSVFAGGWTMEAAEAVCSGDGLAELEVLDLLTTLVDKSLVQYETREGEARYRLLETVRQYARDRLLEAGEGQAVRERHARFFLAMAETAAAEHRWGAWLERFEQEHDNLRAALGWLAEREPMELCLRFAGAVAPFWWLRGHWTEGRERMARLLALPGAELRTEGRARALDAAGLMAQAHGEYEAARSFREGSLAIRRELGEKQAIAYSLQMLGWLASQHRYPAVARDYLEESLALYRELGSQWGIAAALNVLGCVDQDQEEYTTARSRLEEALAIRRAMGEKRGVATTLGNLGHLAHQQGDTAVAWTLYEESLALWRELGAKGQLTRPLHSLGHLARGRGDCEAARAFYAESLEIQQEIGDQRGRAWSLHWLGAIARDQGDVERAAALERKGMILFRDQRNQAGIIGSLRGLAEIAAARGDSKRAARLFGAAEALRERSGTPLQPSERADYDSALAAIRTALGEEAFAAAWAEGRAMSLEEAVRAALAED